MGEILKEYWQLILNLEKKLVEFDTNIKNLEYEFPGENISKEQYEDYKQRKSRYQHALESGIKESFDSFDKLISKARTLQPQLSEPKLTNKTGFPDFLIFGRYRLFFENLNLNLEIKNPIIPRILPFPIKKAIYSFDLKNDLEFLRQLLIRLIQISPVKKLEFTLADTVGLGENFDFVRTLLDNEFVYKKSILTYTSQIEEALKNVCDYIESLIQRQILGFKNWGDYNFSQTEALLPLKVVALVLNRGDLNSTQLQFYLKRIIKHGPKYGVLPVVFVDDSEEKLLESEECNQKRNEKKEESEVETMLKKLAMTISSKAARFEKFKHLKVETQLESFTDEQKLGEILEQINDFCKDDLQVKFEASDFWGGGEKFWSKSAKDGVKVPFGRDKNNEAVEFCFGGDAEPHTIVCGRSGSGKSNLLHVIVQNGSYFYAPTELEFFLLDYKEGVEFAQYVDGENSLTNAGLIAMQSSVSYGLTFLRHVKKEMERRAEAFKKQGTKDYTAYRERGGQMSRWVIMIDEFQVLFVDSSNNERSEIEELFTTILRKGRSYGVHLVLATQTLRGVNVQSSSQMLSQLGNRIALMMSSEDSSSLVGNYEAAQLTGKPKGIYNAFGGVAECNKQLNVAFASPSNLKSILVRTTSEAKKRGMERVVRLYDGEAVLESPNVEVFGEFVNGVAGSAGGDVAVLLGRESSFDEGLFGVKFRKERGSGLMLSGRGEVEKRSVMRSFLLSLCVSEAVERVFLVGVEAELLAFLRGELSSVWGKFEVRGSELFGETIPPKSFVFVDNFDAFGELHDSSVSGSRSSRSGGSGLEDFGGLSASGGAGGAMRLGGGGSAGDSGAKKPKANLANGFVSVLESGYKDGTFVAIFVNEMKRCKHLKSAVFDYFSFRFGFKINRENAEVLFDGVDFKDAKELGQIKRNNAIFYDKQEQDLRRLRFFGRVGE